MKKHGHSEGNQSILPDFERDCFLFGSGRGIAERLCLKGILALLLFLLTVGFLYLLILNKIKRIKAEVD